MNLTNDILVELSLNQSNIVKNLYDCIRIVDPATQKVLLYNGDNIIEKGSSCFGELGKEKTCEKCISAMALKDKKTYMKIESIDNKSYLITVSPMLINNRTLIIELVKEVTDTLFYGHSLVGESCKFSNIINDMKELATKDSLTDIANRRFIDERLPLDVEKCKEDNEPISIIMVDVDYFKNINDTFGHITGDYILKEFASCLSECTREKRDWIGRYGGEEFLVCIPGADKKAALTIAERMQKHIANKTFVKDGEDISVTASFGICSTSDKNITVEELLNLVDKKLYEAKNSGRNKIVY